MELINQKKSPIQDDYIEKYLAEKDLNLTATLDAKAAYKDADFVVTAASTNYDSKKNFFDTSTVENVIEGSVRYIEKSDEKNVIYFNNDLDDMEKVVEEYLSSKYWFIEVRNVQENTAIIQKK